MKFQPLALHHAPLLHHLYLCTPDYFELLGTRPPSLGEVEHDVQTALFDPRRCLELIYDAPKDTEDTDPSGDTVGSGPAQPIGSIDYKLNFPEPGDVTINLLLIRGDLQSSGLGQRAVRHLELRLLNRPPAQSAATPSAFTLSASTQPPASQPALQQSALLQPSPRLLASVLGENPRAVAFWRRLGFSFATDARPVMTWYAKPLGCLPVPGRPVLAAP